MRYVPLAVVVVAVLIGVIVYLRNTKVRGLTRDLKKANHAITEIDMLADRYRDIDSVLASEVRRVIRGLRTPNANQGSSPAS